MPANQSGLASHVASGLVTLAAEARQSVGHGLAAKGYVAAAPVMPS